ncbi:MAG: hypothetical protein MSA15_05465 [Clostridium sp.]|nr:hypothetical protein [Clostridium sp.]
MNIFEYDGEEFDRKLDEVFNNMDKNTLKKELMKCGLIFVNKEGNDMWTEWIETIPLDVDNRNKGADETSIEDYFLDD